MEIKNENEWSFSVAWKNNQLSRVFYVHKNNILILDVTWYNFIIATVAASKKFKSIGAAVDTE